LYNLATPALKPATSFPAHLPRWGRSHAWRTAGWGLVALVTSVANAVRGSTSWLALVNPIQATALFAAMIFLLASRPGARELALFVVGTLGFGFGHRWWLQLFHFVNVPVEQSVLVGAGLGSLLALGVRAARSLVDDQEDWATFHLAAILPCFGMAMGLALDLTIPLHPRVFDPVVSALDGAFGQPSFLVGRVVDAHPALLTLMSFVYVLLPVMMAAVIALERRRLPAASHSMLRAILVAAVGGYALYQIYPVVGPEPLLGSRFPWGGPLVSGSERSLVLPRLGAPRNCVPSLHFTWALLLYWHGRRLGGAARAGTALWLALTALATLATGQHYFVDLIVAVPFAALVDVLAARAEPVTAKRPRAWLIAAASISLAAWYATLLLAPATPPSALPLLSFAAATAAASSMLQASWSAASAAAH
jgi:hypothetical protein